MASAVFGNTLGLGRDERTCYVYDSRGFCQTVLQTDAVMFGINAETCGSDKITNGDFASNANSWYGNDSGGALNNWIWDALGFIYHVIGNTDSVYQNNILTSLKNYVITVSVGRYVNSVVEIEGSLGVYFGTTLVGTITASGDYTFYGTANDDYLRFAPTTDFDGYIDDVTVYEVPTQMLAFLVDENGNAVSTGNQLTFVDGIFYLVNETWASFEVADGCYTLCVDTGCGKRFDNIITNGAFTGSATGWTLGTNWSYSGNQVCKGTPVASSLEQDLSPWLLTNSQYTVSIRLVSGTAGILSISLGGGTSATLNGSDTPGTYEFTLTTPATLTHNGINCAASALFDGCIDDIQVSLTSNSWDSDICSGCISLETTAPECTPKFTWTNDDAGFGLDYENFLNTTPLINTIRLRGYLRLPEYDEDEKEFLKSSGQLDEIYFRSTKTKELVIEYVPEYIADAFSIGKGHDHFYIDGVEYKVGSGMEYEQQTNPDTDLGMLKMRVRKKIVLMENKNC